MYRKYIILMEANADIALIGLAVMGQNLVLNMNDHGYTVAVFNRTVSRVDEFLANEARGTRVIGAHSIPRRVDRVQTQTANRIRRGANGTEPKTGKNIQKIHHVVPDEWKIVHLVGGGTSPTDEDDWEIIVVASIATSTVVPPVASFKTKLKSWRLVLLQKE